MLRFLEIVTFYPAYLEYFYKKYEYALSLDYDTQIQLFNFDGFGISINFVPFLRNLGYETNLIIANNYITQRAWFRENGFKNKISLAPTFDYVQNNLFVVAKQIETLKPDIVFFADTINFHRPFFKNLNYKPKLVIGWRSASISDDLNWSDYDIILSNSKFVLDAAIKLGAKKANEFFPGAPTHFYKLLFSEPKETDLVFIGQLSKEHKKRVTILDYISKHINILKNELKDISVEFYLSGLPTNSLPKSLAVLNRNKLFGFEMFRKYRRTRICLNVDIDFGKGGNIRSFEITSVGSFLLTNENEQILNYFIPGKEIETFGSSEELLEKIIFYLKNEEKRENIASAGYKRCNEQHSLENRAKELVELIEKHINKRTIDEVNIKKNQQSTFTNSIYFPENYSPITGEPSKLIWECDVEKIIEAYIKTYNIDTSYIFKNCKKIRLYECPTTKLQFFSPSLVYGDGFFYKNLSKIPWYYLDEKWEHRVAYDFIKPNSNVLEIGCGKGFFLKKLSQKNCTSVGLELNPDNLDPLNSLNIINETIEEHSQKNFEKYDYICAFQTLEHVPNLKEFLNSCIHSLKKGGYLIFSVPNNDSFISLDSFNLLDLPPHHMTRWKPITFIRIAKFFQLQVVDILYEPLQNYHKDWFKQLINQNLDDPDLKKLIFKISDTMPHLIKGHTMIAFLQRI